MKADTMNSMTRRVASHVLGTAARIGTLAVSFLALAGLPLMVPGTAIAQNKTIVILAPHPDDETLCCAGIIYDALQQGNTVKIVVVTNGDSYAPGVPLGYERQAESVAGMALLGVNEQNLIFMGYGDQSLQSLYQSTSPSTVITSAAGQTQTYANRGLGGVSYHQYLYGAPGLYNRQTVLGDMEAMLQNLQPSDVYTTTLWDDHPDHQSTFNFVVEAILDLRQQGVPLSTRVHETFIHAPCGSCGVPNNLAYVWPGGGPGIQPVFTPTQPYSDPYYLENIWPNGITTPYLWNQTESIPVPAAMQNPVESDNLKAQVITQYPSQGGSTPAGYLFSFVKKNEFFWVRDFSTNVAGLASVSVSSETPGSGQLGTSAVDGFIEGYPGYAPWEWVTQGELAGAWINLSWSSPYTISQVVLYNRQDLVDDVISGTLSFSDGSTVPVGQLPINGNGFLVSFAPKTVTSMKFTIDNAVGQNIGLTELEVYGKLAGTMANHPQIYEGPVASAPYQMDAYGQMLTPLITDAQSTNLSVVAFDVDAQPLSYSWTSDSGTVSGTGSAAVFNPPVVAAPTVVTTTVSVSDGQGGTTQNSTFLTVTPSNTSGISVSSLAVNPTSVSSGSSAVGTVTLSQVAQQGAVVLLSSSNPAIATVLPTVTVAPGSNSASFPVNTVYVASTTSVTISASLGGVAQNASLQVLQPPVIVSSVTFSPATVGGGNSTTGTVTLSGPALGGGALVTLTSGSPSVATVPASVTIPAGATSANFTTTTPPLTSAVSVTVSARYVGQTTNASLRVAPYVTPSLASIASISVSSESTATQQLGIKAIDGIVDGSPGDYTKEWATNGQLAGAWIKLTWGVPVTTSQVVLYDRPNLTDNVTSGTLSFSDGTTVPVGTLPNNGAPLAVSFSPKTITWMQFTVNTAVGLNIGLAEIIVNGSITQASTISAVTVSPTAVTGGMASTGTVALDGIAPSGGTVVTLASSDTSTATVPTSVTVPSGSLTATFPITTTSVSTTTGVVISGSYNGTQGATLTVNPIAISSLSLSPTMFAGGALSSTGTVVLTGPAPAGGTVVTLTTSDATVATVPATITISSGSTTGIFSVTTNAVAATARVAISAAFNGTQAATLWVTPVISGGGMQQFVTDSFSRSDGPLGSDWSTVLDSPSVPQIASQQVQSPYVYSVALYYGGINWPADQYAQAQVLQSNGGSSGPAVRMTSNGSYYAGTVGSLGSGTANVYIILDSGGNRSIVASSSTATVLPNDYLQLTAQGTTLTLTDVTQSATLLTVTDSTLPAGYPGFYVGNGGLLANWSAGLTAAPPTLNAIASDDFNRVDAPNLGPSWTVGPGLYSIQIVDNQIESDGQGQPAGQGHGKEYYTASTFPTDQWSQAQVIAATNDVNGAILRYQGSSDTHYVGFVSTIGPAGTCSVVIDRDINGAPSVLASDSHYCSVTSGDYVRLQAQGQLLSYVDVTTGALLLTVLDSQITGGFPGWSLNPIGGTPIAANWSGGQFSAVTQLGLSSVSLSPTLVQGGTSSTGTVTLNGPAPSGGAVVTLSSSNTAAAQVPASVTVAANATTATFTVTTNSVAADTQLIISGTYGSTQNASFTVTATPAVLNSVSVSPASVQGGSSSTGTVTLSGPAPVGGAVVTLSSSNPAAQVPASVTVAANATTATFSVTTNSVSTDTTLTISGAYGTTQNASFIVTATPAVLNSVSVSPASVQGGGSSTGTVTLSGPAPVGGALVTLSSSNPAAQVPASVTVTANATTATFTVTTSAVATTTSLTISGTFGTTQNASFTVTAPVLNSVSVSPASVQGGGSSTGTVTLSGPAPVGGAVVTLSSSNPAAQVPASVTVAANATTATFPVTTSPVATTTSLTISGTYGTTQNATFTVTRPVLNSLSLNPTSVPAGATATGTVALSGPAPAGGALVTLSSSNPAAAQVPASVTVAANATTATFTVTTSSVAANTALTISGTYGSTQSAGFTVTSSVLSTITLNPTSVNGGTSVNGSVTLTKPAPTGGAVVTLSNSNTAVAQAPASVTVAAGATSATFTVTTTPVASNTLLTITAGYGSTKTASLTVLTPTVSSIGVSPTSVIGGSSSTVTVRLTGPAPAGGAVITLSSSNTAAVQVPATVTVAANATSATFRATTSPVTTTTSPTISGTRGNTLTTTLTVTPPTLTTIGVSPSSVIGGTSSTGTVILTGPAPAGGAVVSLSSNNTAAASVPASVTVAANATSATFTVTTSGVATNTSPTISGIYGVTRTTTITVVAATMNTFSLNPTSVIGGTSSTGTVTLTGPAPAGGAVVALSSSNTATAKVPASVMVPANATSTTFTVTTSPVATTSSATITVTYNGTRTANLTITLPTLSTLTLNPTTVKGPSPSSGTVTLSGPAPTGGAVVTLSSNKTSAATVPASVTVAAGATTANFTVITKTVPTSTAVTISATKGGTLTANLTVTP